MEKSDFVNVMFAFHHHIQSQMTLCFNNVLLYMKMRRRHRTRKYNRILQSLSYRLSRSSRGERKIRNQDWWDNVVECHTDEEYVETFRVTRTTFKRICDELREELRPKLNFLQHHWKNGNVVTVEKKVGISLYFFGNSCDYTSVAERFGIHKSTVCKVMHEFTSAVEKVLTPKYLHWPYETEAAGGKSMDLIGTFGVTHIPINRPTEREFLNSSGWPALVLQAVVDSKHRFLGVHLTSPKKIDEASTSFCKKINRLLPKNSVQKNGNVIVDGRTQMITGSADATPIPTDIDGDSVKKQVEIAFERLKSRWRCLLLRLEVNHSFVPQLVTTCCTLHNMVEFYEDPFRDDWLQFVKEADVLYPQPKKILNGNVEEA